MFGLRSTVKLILVHEVDVCSSQPDNAYKSIVIYSELTDETMTSPSFDIYKVF